MDNTKMELDNLKDLLFNTTKLTEFQLDQTDWTILKELYQAAFTKQNKQDAIVLNSKLIYGTITYDSKQELYLFEDNYDTCDELDWNVDYTDENVQQSELIHEISEKANYNNFYIDFDEYGFKLNASFRNIEEIYDLIANLLNFKQDMQQLAKEYNLED